MSKKKITRVEDEDTSSENTSKTFTPTAKSKGKATRLRVIAGILWFFAIVAQIGAIMYVLKQPENFMAWTIGLIVVDLILAIIGSVLWKKSNRLDPASEKNKFMFFMQNQLGLVVAVIAFLPLVIFILTNKDLDTKQKGILGGIAGVALVIAGVTGTDFNPPSVEQYTEESNHVEELTGTNHVYWTKSGTKYHLFSDCHAINKDVTKEIFEGTVANARELKSITELCKFCENTAESERSNELVEMQEEEEREAAE